MEAASPLPRAERILLVDDDPDIARFVQVNLQAAGFGDVVLAHAGEEALARVDETHFDLIITGVVMPKLSGHELVRELRRRPDTAETPIMYLTARAEPEHVAEGYAAGANDYMFKPFDPRELVDHVRRLLEA
jgi:DNA-binding response OmpR family regulator